MIYITDEDLIADSQERLIDESTAGVTDLKNTLEKKVVDRVITSIGSRYNTDLIFDEEMPIRNEVLVDIISAITLFRLYKRNSARKLTETIKNEYDKAMKDLERINNGSLPLTGLPLAGSTEAGKPDSDTMFGNFTNEDYYI